MMKIVAAAAFAVAAVQGTSLTAANFDEEMAGKSAFIKFQAPWWGHCKAMKPAWEKLEGEFSTSKTVLIGDVDCTVEQSLCSKYGVRGYPTIKYFTGATAADGDAYEGGRDYDALLKFAQESLGPSCGVNNKDLCNEEQLKELEASLAMSKEDRDAAIASAEKAAADAEETFKTEVGKLQSKYEELTKEKEEAVKKANEPLRWLRAANVPVEEGHSEL